MVAPRPVSVISDSSSDACAATSADLKMPGSLEIWDESPVASTRILAVESISLTPPPSAGNDGSIGKVSKQGRHNRIWEGKATPKTSMLSLRLL